MSDPGMPRRQGASSERPSARRARPSAASQPRSSTRRSSRARSASADASPSPGSHAAPSGATGVQAPLAPQPTSHFDASRIRTRSLRAHGAAEERPGISRGAAAAIVLGVLAVALVAIFFVLTRCVFTADEPEQPAVEAGQLVTVVIPSGAGGDVIASELMKAGVIDDEKAFMQAVASQGADMKLKPGTYELVTGMSPENVVAQLVAGPNTQEGRVTIPEGITVTQTADIVQGALGIPTDQFLAQAKASNYVADYPFLGEVADDSLEGYLWAKTYDFSGHEISADSVIRAMLDQYAAELPEIDFEAGEQEIASAYGYDPTDYEILKLASIINLEASSEEDRALVSSVFWNRIRQGMPLQSDATMRYVTGGEVTADDLKVESPYNTYLNQGLPPTPVCTPDYACIEAALHPAKTEYLYFLLIDDDGYSNHTFSNTYEEHLAAIERARQEMGELGL